MSEIQEDRRGFFRHKIKSLVDFELPHDFMSAFATNIGEKGMYVETLNPLPIGTKAVVRFILYRCDHVFEVRSTILWKIKRNQEEKLSGLTDGMGVGFDMMDEEDRQKLSDYFVLCESGELEKEDQPDSYESQESY
ncbi:MAG: PilZ domain-containing protein [Bdellovibrionota bacterium]